MSEETLLEFPCQFPIKAMGKNTPDFDSVVANIVSLHVEEITDCTIKTRPSKGGKYLAVTIEIQASSKKQLDAIYQGLTDCPDVLMAL